VVYGVTLHFEWHEAVVAVFSFVFCVVLVALRNRVPRLCGRVGDLGAVQSMHSRLTPRVGGGAIFAAMCLSALFVSITIEGRYQLFLLGVGLLFVVGLLEDLGFHVTPRKRLLAAASASLLIIGLLGVWLPRAGIPGLDGVMDLWAIGVPLTLLVTAGIANGFNLIDGVNGLASFTAIAAAVAMSFIAQRAGYTEMVHLVMMMAAATLGFFLMNFPFGLIFLGDAGAYTLGFVLSWFGVSILYRAPDASPWAILLTLFWPVADTLLAIYRRSRRKADAMAPDRLHVHQMVLRGLEICILGRKRRRIANPLTTLVLAPFVVTPPLVGVMFWNQNMNAFLAVLVFGALFFAGYVAAPVLIRRFMRRGRASPNPFAAQGGVTGDGRIPSAPMHLAGGRDEHDCA